ncbi:hypothetical protein Q5X45_01990 [Acinetobacter baumannii]|nr:hypothetical protein [Acinetobacter baumannii]
MQCDFQQFAINLYNLDKSTTDQATIRTCISRLYYFIYHKVNQWLVDNHSDVLNSFGGGTHERIQFCLNKIARITLNLRFNTLSTKLNSLHDKRCKADYKLENKLTSKNIELMILEVDQALNLFNELTSK